MAGPLVLRDYAPMRLVPDNVPASRASTALSGLQRSPDVQAEFSSPFQPPGQPLTPGRETQEEGARRFQYRSGYNVSMTPRAQEGLTPFSALHNMVDACDILSIAIRYQIEQIAALEWAIIPRPGMTASQAELDEVRARLEYPDGYTPWQQWFTGFLEEVLVTDAGTIIPQYSLKGDVLALDLADGSLFRPLTDRHGRRPQGNAPAYQEVIYGKVFWEGTADEVIYVPKNVRNRSMYGRSPTEEILITLSRWLRREVFDLTYYSDSNVPAALVGAPGDMDPDAIADLQAWFDDVVSQQDRRRSLTFVPTNNGRMGVFEFKQPITDPAIEEHLITIICAGVGVQAQSLGFMTNANKANSGGQENEGYRRRAPYTIFGSNVISRCIKLMGYPNSMLQFQGNRPEEDKLALAQEADLYIRNGTWNTEEVREAQGKEPTSKFPRMVYTATGPLPLPSDPTSIDAVVEAQAAIMQTTADSTGSVDDEDDEASDQPGADDAPAEVDRSAKLAEIQRWERFAAKSRTRAFEPRVLDVRTAGLLQTLLENPDPAYQPSVWRKAAFAEARALVMGAGRSR